MSDNWRLYVKREIAPGAIEERVRYYEHWHEAEEEFEAIRKDWLSSRERLGISMHIRQMTWWRRLLRRIVG